MLNENDKISAVSYNERKLTAFTADYKKSLEGFYKLRNTIEIIKSDEHILEAKYTECLRAKTFKEADTVA